MSARRAALLASCLLLGEPFLPDGGARAAEVAELEAITVTATRVAQPAFAVPAAITRADLRRDTAGVNLAESLAGMPGLLARDRQNYAQDTQISVRGFGARSTFGIRGVRLYIDGVPATQPDGQGQVSHFNLASAGAVEVLRGPYSALYGNSSGGVIQLFSADGAGAPSLRVDALAGSAAMRRAALHSEGSHGRWAYNLGLSRFVTDGQRGHSAASRTSAQLRLTAQLRERDRLTLSYNDFDAPDAEDPLGLTRAQLDADPLQSAPTALQFNTRKSAAQQQGALAYELGLGDSQQLRLTLYRGARQIEQYLAVPVAPQADPRHSGGVVDLNSWFDGGELRWSGAHVVAGASYDALTQRRRGYENFSGSTLGVRGALRRDERNLVAAFDQYLQFSADLGARWTAAGGLRHSLTRFSSRDDFIRSGNGDDSGRVSYEATTPVASLMWHVVPSWNVYAAYGRGFETPTLAELAYRPDGSAGLNLALRSARNDSFELGSKWRGAAGRSAELAVFRADGRNELAVATNSGGRTTYANLGATRREGLELAAQWPFSARAGLALAGTWLSARLPGGLRMPGVPAQSLYGAWHWDHAAGWNARLEGRWLSSVQANDLNTASAGGYASFDLSLGRRWQLQPFQLQAFLRAENLLDRRYVGSLIVNEANARYFEPAAGRTLALSISLAWR